MPLELTLNYAQTRLSRSRVGLTALGLDLNGDAWNNTYIDPVTSTLMLLPSSLRADFHAANDTDRLKQPKSAFTLATGANWREETAQDASDGPYLVNTTNNESAILTTAIGKNRGFCLSLFNYNSGTSNGTQEFLQFGVTENPGTTIAREWRLYSNGQLEYWLDDVLQERLRLPLPSNRQYLDITVLPFRRREILMLTSPTQGVSIVCSDIAEDEDDPVFWSGTAKLYWKVVSGKAKVQTHLLTFPSTGYATTIPGQFGRPPESGVGLETWTNDAPATGITNARVLGDPSYGVTGTHIVSAVGLYESDGTTAFSPNGTATDARIRVTMTSSNGHGTPFVYGVHLAYEGDTADTDDTDELDIQSYAMGDRPPTLEIPDDPGGVRFTASLNMPETLHDGDAAGLLSGSNWPLRIVSDGMALEHVTLPIDFAEGTDDVGSRATLTSRDRWALLESYQFRESLPLDGLLLTHASNDCAVRRVLSAAGIPDAVLDLETDTFRLPEVPSRSGEANFAAEVGETAAAVLDRLHQDYAASFAMGFYPAADGEKFRFKSPATIGTTPKLTLYRTAEDAVAAEVDESLTYGEFRSHPLEVEANEVYVTGMDPRTQRPIQAYYRDTAAQDPTAYPRPDNWSGVPCLMGVIEPRVTTDASATRLIEYLAPIVTARRYAAEWVCQWPFYDAGGGVLLPLWTWDTVTLDGRGDYLISTISVEFVAEQTGGVVWRLARMSGIKVGTGTPYGQGGRSLMGMVKAARQASRNRLIRRPGWERMRGTVGLVAAVI